MANPDDMSRLRTQGAEYAQWVAKHARRLKLQLAAGLVDEAKETLAILERGTERHEQWLRENYPKGQRRSPP
jgi:hypothetical protein